jgi:hypothetical protein
MFHHLSRHVNMLRLLECGSGVLSVGVLMQALLAELVRHLSLHYSTMDRHHIFGLKPISAAAALPHLTPSLSKGGLPTMSESAGLAGAGLVDVKAATVQFFKLLQDTATGHHIRYDANGVFSFSSEICVQQ